MWYSALVLHVKIGKFELSVNWWWLLILGLLVCSIIESAKR
jgi:hypothetical protein